MAHVFKLGALDLSEFLRVNPGDGLDPADSDFIEPKFSESPLREGGALVNLDVGNKELVFPLLVGTRVNKTRQTVNNHRRDIQRELLKSNVEVEWRETGGSSIFYDLVSGRLEEDFNYRVSEHDRGKANLRLWVRPYGHTGTSRLVATAAGSGAILKIAIPSTLEGDVSALLTAKMTVGTVYVPERRMVAFAVLPHASWTTFIPAASISVVAGITATLAGASGAQGSQIRAVDTAASYGLLRPVYEIPLQIPTVYAGVRTRVLHLGRSGWESGVHLRAMGPLGDYLGATAVASNLTGYGVTDLGTLNLPEWYESATALLRISAGVHHVPSKSLNLTGPGLVGAEQNSLVTNGLVLLPDETTVLARDGVPSLISVDDFYSDGVLDEVINQGHLDELGNAWATGLSDYRLATTTQGPKKRQSKGGNVGADAFATRQDLRVAINQPVGDMRMVMRISDHSSASPLVGPKKDITPSQAAWGIFNASYIAIGVRSGAASVLVASMSLASVGATVIPYRLVFETAGPQAGLWMENLNNDPILSAPSIGGSHAAIEGDGYPGVFIYGAGPPEVRHFHAEHNPSAGLAGNDVYHFDGVEKAIYRAAGSVIKTELTSNSRGAIPQLSAPSAAAAVVISLPFDDGPVSDILSVEVRARERFTFGR